MLKWGHTIFIIIFTFQWSDKLRSKVHSKIVEFYLPFGIGCVLEWSGVEGGGIAVNNIGEGG